MRLARFVGKRGCDDQTYAEALEDDSVNIIDTSAGKGNVSVHLLRNGKRAEARFDRDVRDLFDLGICVYIADELLDREHGYDGWTRPFRFVLPVSDPKAWRSHEAELRKLLGHLSGDQYKFEWMKRGSLGGYGRHRKTIPRGFDAVCLFSGGVDSLLGAYELLQNGKKLILCGHYADGISSKAQMDVFASLREEFGKSVVLLQCHVARTRRPTATYTLSEKREDSHRPRSFLFLTTAVGVATLAGVNEIYIPENGLIALNAPLGVSRSGTLSTRTVHPRFLFDFVTLVNELGVYEGTLQNPFLLKSKTDMLKDVEKGLHPLLRRSVSCAHSGSVRWSGRRGTYHCGYCVPCLYRRVAFMEAGIDNPSDYICDVFKNLTKCSETEQCDFRFLARFAANVGRMTPAKRQAVVLEQGIFTPNECNAIGGNGIDSLKPFADMIQRWAKDFLKKVDAVASPSTRRAIGRP